MKAPYGFFLLLLAIAVYLFPVETIQVKSDYSLSQTLENQELPIRMITDFDFEGEFLYLLSSSQGVVLKVKLKTGELTATISSKGQGPGELDNPSEIHVCNNKIYIFDEGYKGIKIFDQSGKYLSAIKVHSRMFFPRSTLKATFAVDENEQIFHVEPNPAENKLIGIYDGKTGKKIKSLISENLAKYKDRKSKMEISFFGIRLDKENNLILLFSYLCQVRKYNSYGKLLWENRIKNEYLEEYLKVKKKAGITVNENEGSMRYSPIILCFDVTANGTIIIGHSGLTKGGFAISSDGRFNYFLMGVSLHNSFLRIKNMRAISGGGIIEAFTTFQLPSIFLNR